MLSTFGKILHRFIRNHKEYVISYGEVSGNYFVFYEINGKTYVEEFEEEEEGLEFINEIMV